MIGKILDRRYQIVEYLGHGSFAETYLAIDIRRPGNPQCVIKHLRPKRTTKKSLQTARFRFKREVQTLEKLGRNHNQIPQLLAYFEAKEDFFIVEDYIPGPCLSTELVAGKCWSEEKTIQLLKEILEILVFVHSQGVIHRDVNPKNIIRRLPDQKLVLIDFGAVKEILNSHSQEQNAMTIAVGTPAYMPIEQFQGNPQLNSDIYATGIIGIQALTGAVPKEIPKLKSPSSSNPFLAVWQEQVQISEKLATVLEKMVCDDYTQRYLCAAEALKDLQILSQILPPTILELPQPLTKNQEFVGLRDWFSPEQIDVILRWVCWGGIVAVGVASLIFLLHNQTQMKAEEYYRRGLEWAQRGEANKALEDYNQAIALEPDDVAAYQSRGTVRLQLEDYQGATEDFSHVIALNPTDFNAYNQRCQAQLSLTKLADALADCSRAIALQENSSVAYKNRCLVYLHLGAYPRALEDCQRALELNSEDAQAYHHRGLVYSESNRELAAITDFMKAFELGFKTSKDTQKYPFFNKPLTRTNRCVAYLNLGNYNGAIAECSWAIKLDQTYSPAYENRCLAEYKKSAYQKALQNCNRALELNKNQAGAYRNRGLVRQATQDNAGAVLDFSQAISLNNNDHESWVYRARIYAKLADYQKAIADYTQALRLVPTAGDIYYERGRTLALIKQQNAALDDLQKASKFCIDQGNTTCYNDSRKLIKKLSD